ncbi:gamma-glutamyl-gamma-aminobutyrate hydrolase family protein [Psychrobacillus sp. FSL K6-1267]|uniref:gamma-glutamyl-gamma-aminobutyrate hydrolase family protein n=1 Tax=Psychrobacillus sp. FSL K6-1267 TaxID=2921543 RepID=UPI0030F6F4FE
MKPIIGITAEVKDDKSYYLSSVYSDTVLQAGGVPLLIPLIPDKDMNQLCQQIDGLIITGGEDIDPAYYGELPHPSLKRITPQLDEMEFALVQKILELDKPYIGTCRGLHMLNVVMGGSLHQSIHDQREEYSFLHRQNAIRTHRSHPVKLDKKSKVFQMFQEEEFKVNSFHHQGVNRVGEGLKVAATAPDGIVEAVESENHTFIYGFQWHPEEFALIGDEPSKKLFAKFIEAAIERKNKERA